MQKLHLVGITPELDGLILSTRKGAKSGSFVVSVDAAVLQQLTEGAKGRGGARSNGTRPQREPRISSPQSELTPREMQELLRLGWTIDEVADEAGVDVDWVSRFASPVLAELRRVVDAAREMVFDKPRVGESALPLAASVRRNVAERGLRFTDEDFDDAWRAQQLDDVLWVVVFEYTSRGREQRAEWVVDLDEGELASHNRLGTQLGHVASARRRVSTTPPAKAPAKKKTAAKPRSRQSTTKKTTAKKTAAKKRSTKPHAAEPTPTPQPAPRPANQQHDPYREELRRRLADPVATSPRPAPAPPPAPRPTPPGPPPPPAPRPRPEPTPPPPRAREVEHRPVAIIGPTVRSLTRKPAPRREPSPPPPPPKREPPPPRRDEELPDLSWSPTRGPMPAPEPIAVPEDIKEKVASPLGQVDDDLPAETWFPKGPTFKGAQQGSSSPKPAADAPPRRRRTEPLRGR